MFVNKYIAIYSLNYVLGPFVLVERLVYEGECLRLSVRRHLLVPTPPLNKDEIDFILYCGKNSILTRWSRQCYFITLVRLENNTR